MLVQRCGQPLTPSGSLCEDVPGVEVPRAHKWTAWARVVCLCVAPGFLFVSPGALRRGVLT